MPQDPNGDLVTKTHLTAIAETYKNPDKNLIADRVLPRVMVGETLFSYQQAKDKYDAFRLPETAVGPRGRVNQLNLGMTEVTASTEDNAIDIPLGYVDLKREKARERATELGASIVGLRNEKRVADVVFNAASYAAGFKEVVTGTDQFNDASYDGDPIGLIQDGLDKMLLPANVLTFGRPAWSKFRRLPAIVSAILGNAGDKGLVKPEQVAALFGLDECLVGEGVLVTSKPGESLVMPTVWGNHIAATHRDRTATTAGGVTFGYNAQFDKIVSEELKDQDVGMRGGVKIRTGESTKAVIVASMAGYFWQNVVS